MKQPPSILERMSRAIQSFEFCSDFFVGDGSTICLYLGTQEKFALKEAIASTTMRFDPKLVGQRPQYEGCDIYYVDADSHLACGVVSP